MHHLETLYERKHSVHLAPRNEMVGRSDIVEIHLWKFHAQELPVSRRIICVDIPKVVPMTVSKEEEPGVEEEILTHSTDIAPPKTTQRSERFVVLRSEEH